MIITLLSLTSLITIFLLIWFKTDALVSYLKLFRLSNAFCVDAWEAYRDNEDYKVGYFQYLRMIHPNGFFIKLITCPVCISVWLCLMVSFFTKLIYFPIICVASLLIYYAFIKLMG